MDGNDTLVQVDIHGRTYSLRSDGDPGQLRELAAYVDRRMTEISQGTATVDTTRIAVLAALNLADEVFEERRLASGGPREGAAARREERLCRMLDDILAP